MPWSGPAVGPSPPAEGDEPAVEETAGAMESEPAAETPAAEVPPEYERAAPVEEPQAEELVGEKGQIRDELWACVSVSMQQQGERMGDSMFGLLIEPAESDDGASLGDITNEEGEWEADRDAQLERDVEASRQEGFTEREPEKDQDMDELNALEVEGRRKLNALEAEKRRKQGVEGLSVELLGMEDTTAMPKGAGLSGELPGMEETTAGLSGKLPRKESGDKEDEDGERDRAAGERQEAGGVGTQTPTDGSDSGTRAGMGERNSDTNGGYDGHK